MGIEPSRARSWAAVCSPAESPEGLWQRVFDQTGCEAVNSFAGISESFLRTDPRMQLRTGVKPVIRGLVRRNAPGT